MEYQGKPYADDVYTGGAQIIPGKVFCAYYDLGGEGVAYHDADAVNHGSGVLNPVDGSYLHSFRIDESVDTSYTKAHDAIDLHPYNDVQPEMDMLYVGWTEPGEWLKYTVSVEQAGRYAVSILYTSHEGGKISLSSDAAGLTAEIRATYKVGDPVDWRQWHHWNIQELGEIQLEAGVQVLTLATEETGQMNYGYLTFTLL